MMGGRGRIRTDRRRFFRAVLGLVLGLIAGGRAEAPADRSAGGLREAAFYRPLRRRGRAA